MTTQTEVQPLSIPDAEPQPYPSADTIIAAFRCNHLTPKRDAFFFRWTEPWNYPSHACALGALAYDRYGKLAYGLSITRALPNLPDYWRFGLVDGFDGARVYSGLKGDPAFDAGYATGQAVARWAGFAGDPS